jgi:hypothetical protein
MTCFTSYCLRDTLMIYGMCVCVYVRTCINECMYVCKQACMHARMHIRTYLCMLCMYVCMYENKLIRIGRKKARNKGDLNSKYPVCEQYIWGQYLFCTIQCTPNMRHFQSSKKSTFISAFCNFLISSVHNTDSTVPLNPISYPADPTYVIPLYSPILLNYVCSKAL